VLYKPDRKKSVSRMEITMTYNRTFAILVVSLIVVVGDLLLPSYAQGQCNAATVQGSYGFRFSSFFIPRSSLLANSFPNAEAGRIVFTPNSAASLDGTLTGSQKGNVGGGPSEFTFTGTYSVNSDCTGTLTRTLANGDVQELAIAMVQSGTEIEFAFHSTSLTPQTGEGVMKRQ
jgi:hypothetical protein